MSVKLTAELIEGFAGLYLSPRYDDLRPTPQFHREAWSLYCSAHPQCEVIAPRDHAKSTALTFDYGLAEVMFRTSDYVIIIGSSEEMAQEQLSNISEELHTNDALRRDFHVQGFEVDQKTEIVVTFTDGHRFRILARGAEQRIRGRLWNGKRPNLIIGDDMEEDEQVESRERRRKFRRWFFRACRQALSRNGKIRVHGTILHDDALLSRLRTNSAWKHLFYRAHRSFDDFRDILWPERWSESDLRAKQREFLDDNDAAGYSQEILNDPMDSSEAYLRKDDFLPMAGNDYIVPKLMGAAWDFAVSEDQAHDNTSCTVGGRDLLNTLHVVDQRLGRWDSLRIVDEMFSVQSAWNPDFQWVEDGVIWKALAPIVYREMQRRGRYMNLVPMPSVKSKAVRGRTLQKMHRGRGMRFDKNTSWYAGYEFELLRFTEGARALRDDQFDSTSLLCRGFAALPDPELEDFTLTEDEWAAHRRRTSPPEDGRSKVTGY